MTDAELAEHERDAIESRDFDAACDRRALDGRVLELAAEVRRLRGLIKRAEWAGRDVSCAWCSGQAECQGDSHQHDADCPAFTPDGNVK